MDKLKDQLIAVDLKMISYERCLSYQKQIHTKRVAQEIDDVILLLEHYPVITLGKSGTKDDLLVPEEELARKGIPVYHVNRGGQATCHYPGQLVVYPIMDLKNCGQDLHLFVDHLEETIIRALADFGVLGEKIPKLTGVWVGGNKIASIGIEVKNWVSMHGFSINIIENWPLFSCFIPCGIRNRETTFLQSCSVSPMDIGMGKIKQAVIKHFSKVFATPISGFFSKLQFENQYPFLNQQNSKIEPKCFDI